MTSPNPTGNPPIPSASTPPTPNLPILSLPNLAPSLSTACRTHGFFYLTDHGIPPSLLNEILSLARRFFLESSSEEKERIKRKKVGEGGDGARGYQLLGENVTGGRRDWHEGVDFYKEWEGGVDGAEAGSGFLRGRNLWPETEGLREVYERYIEECKRVGKELVRAMGEALGLEGGERDILSKATEESFWVLRMIGYPPLQDNEEGVSCGEHSDYGCVTLLLADATIGALQVQLKDGSWINADPVPGAFVVNIGDMVERWTNGEWKSTKHRVIHQASNYRISVPFFFEPNFDAEIRPLRKCVEKTGGVPKFEPVVYGDHLTAKAETNFYGTDET